MNTDNLFQESEDEDTKRFDDGEADDEQSDWHDSSTGPVFCLTDDEDSTELPLNLFAPEGKVLPSELINIHQYLTKTWQQVQMMICKLKTLTS